MKEFNCTNCGECCGPVPVTHQELQAIKKTIKEMPQRRINQLMSQKREPLKCIFWDTKKKNCSIYESRPEVCKMFGFYQGMECPDNRSHATQSRFKGDQRLKAHKGQIAGILTLQIKWKDLIS